MRCPNCGSKSLETLKSKVSSSKSKEVNELLLKCEKCEKVFKESISQNKLVGCPLIISENEKSFKTTIDLLADEKLAVDDVLMSERGKVKITSLENKRSGRSESELAKDVVAIWANSIEIPARVGVSIDYIGDIESYKVDVARDFKFNIDDVVKIKGNMLRINSIKTEERKLRKGFSKADITKRIYGKPVDFKRFDYDLTDKIVISQNPEKKRKYYKKRKVPQ